MKNLSDLPRKRNTTCYLNSQSLQVIHLDKELNNCPGHGWSKDEATQRIMVWKPKYNLKQPCLPNGLKVKKQKHSRQLPRCIKKEDEDDLTVPNDLNRKQLFLYGHRELEYLLVGL